MTITLTGAPRTKKNSQRIIRRGQYSSILPSRAYMEYAEDCAEQLLAQHAVNLGIDHPVNVACVYFMPTRRRVDLVNLLEATCDILKDCYVVLDDHCGIIASHDGSRVEYDKINPRVEITITDKREDGDARETTRTPTRKPCGRTPCAASSRTSGRSRTSPGGKSAISGKKSTTWRPGGTSLTTHSGDS